MKEESSSPSDEEAVIVFPGDQISLGSQTKTNLGHGLVQDIGVVKASKFGLLVREKDKDDNNLVWVLNSQKMYLPRCEEEIIGTVIDKHAENYKVEIGTTHPAQLSSVAFEGATRRNKPNIPVGALVFCRVVLANKDIDTELTCTSPHCKKDWVTKEAIYGELKGGYVFNCPLDLCQKLNGDNCVVLQELGKNIPYEIAVGVNGRVWVNSGDALHTVLITNAILNSHNLSDVKVAKMVQRLCERAM